MIYLKKPDGTIEQFEDDMRRALDLDKEIQGESFGEIYISETLPDEDRVNLKLMTQKELDDKIKQNRIFQIKSECAVLDAASIRPMRDGETDIVKKIKAKIDILRKEYNDLQNAQ